MSLSVIKASDTPSKAVDSQLVPFFQGHTDDWKLFLIKATLPRHVMAGNKKRT
jgi:hypothetical protein